MRMFPHKVRILGGSQHFVELLKAHSITNTQTYIATFTLIRRSTNPFHFVVKTRTCATTLNASSELFAYKTRSLHVRRHSAVRQSDIFNHKRGCYVPQNHYQWQVLSVGHLACPPIIRCVPAQFGKEGYIALLYMYCQGIISAMSIFMCLWYRSKQFRICGLHRHASQASHLQYDLVGKPVAVFTPSHLHTTHALLVDPKT